MASAANANRGRFWGGDDSESESSSSSSGEGSQVDAGGVARPGAVAKATRFAAVDSDSSSEDEGRVARSVKDRTFDGLAAIIKTVNNQLKMNHWVGPQEAA